MFLNINPIWTNTKMSHYWYNFKKQILQTNINWYLYRYVVVGMGKNVSLLKWKPTHCHMSGLLLVGVVFNYGKELIKKIKLKKKQKIKRNWNYIKSHHYISVWTLKWLHWTLWDVCKVSLTWLDKYPFMEVQLGQSVFWV